MAWITFSPQTGINDLKWLQLLP